MKVEGATRSLETLVAQGRDVDPKRVAGEFEAMLIGQIWKQAMKPLGVSHVLSGGSAGQIYQDLFVEELSRQTALTRGFGLAEELGAELRGKTAQPEPQDDE